MSKNINQKYNFTVHINFGNFWFFWILYLQIWSNLELKNKDKEKILGDELIDELLFYGPILCKNGLPTDESVVVIL